MKEENLITASWSDYELLDSGNGRKLERFDSVVTDRPDAQAIWSPLKSELWKTAAAVFNNDNKEQPWSFASGCPTEWTVGYGELKFNLRFGNFKHLGLFPEHASQWEWVQEKVSALKTPNVLNLFGYTGAATLAAAKAGAKVTHVDSSKQSVEWASENARTTGLPEDSVRWIVDDAAAFAKREIKRGAKYEGIVLDPPAFGRGSKGQVWHIEEDLMPLLQNLKQILSDKPGSFVLLSGYAAGFAPQSFAQAIASVFPDVVGTFGTLNIQELSARVLPTGIYVRFVL